MAKERPGIHNYTRGYHMRAFIDNMWAQLREYLAKMPKGNRIRLAVFSVLVIALAIVLVAILSRTTYATMHTAQDQAEAGNIAAALRDMGVQPRQEGLRILVPEDRVSELRNELAAQGVLGPSSLDLGIMGGAAGFSVTDAHARQLYDAQLQENIRVAIMAVPIVQNAIVLARQGETSPFRHQAGVRAPSVAVMLSLRGGGMLSKQEAQAMAEFIKNAVPGINYENITIADDRLNHYPVGDSSMDFGIEIDSRLTLQNLLAGQIQAQLEQLLMPIFGARNVEIVPRLVLNFDKVAREVIEFSPPIAGELDGIARSSHDLWEAARRDGVAEGIPGTDSNALGTVEYPYGSLEDGGLYERRVNERNYEINQTTEVIERAQGTIEYLSIAIAINEDAVDDDYTDQVINLVTRGLGVAPANVAVERIPFDYIDTTDEDMRTALAALEAERKQRELIQEIIKWSVILLLGIMFILLLRTIFQAVKPPEEPEPLLVGAGIDYLADGDFSDVTQYEDVDLQKKSSGLEQIERFIDKDPAAVAQLLRNWLSDE